MDMSEHAGHRERLRARYLREGLNGFAPHEVLELLLTYAIPRADTNPMAHALMNRFGSLHAVLEASPQELEQVPGVGPQAATLLSMLLPVLRMYEQEKLLPRKRFSNRQELTAYCRTLFLGAGCEQFYLLSFDAGMQLLAATCLSSGTPGEVSVSPRLIMQELMRRNAAAAVLTHNHPSGSPKPSQADLDITRDLLQTLRGVDIRLIDHIIIAGAQDCSLLNE